MAIYQPAGSYSETVLYKGITTSDGVGGGTTLIDSALVGVNDFVTDTIIIIQSGDCRRETRDVSSFTNVTGTITVGTAFSVQIVSGVTFAIIARMSADVEVAALQTDIGDFSSRANDNSLLDVIGLPDVAGKDLYTCLVTDRLDNGTYGLSALHTDLATKPSTTDIGVRQVFEKAITTNANAGATVVGTVANQACVIESIIIYADANGALPASTTAATTDGLAGVAGAITFLDAGLALTANLDTAGDQVSWTSGGSGGAVRLAVGYQIITTLAGGGANPTDLTFIITYYSSSTNGGTIS